MIQSDSIEAELQSARDEIAQLRSELRASERHLARVLEMVGEHQRHLNTHHASIARVERILMDLTTGRLWRTLRAAGNIAKRFLPASRDENGYGRRNTYLVCDEPLVTDNSPRSGKICVRGWCLAEDGVDTVQLDVPGLPVLETEPCIPRPDIKKSFPDLDATGRSGFLFEFDSLPLPNGRYKVTLRALSHGAVLRETKTSIDIDHENGFTSEYARWIHEFERPENDLIKLKLRSFEFQPLISIVTPVFNPKPSDLRAALESVLSQSYPRWELCLADDCSTDPEIHEILNRYQAKDGRIKVTFRNQQGGISQASNSAWQMATGDYLCFLDHDDLLSPNALAHVCQALNESPNADLLYSDEDKVDRNGNRYEPFFKPAWSPDLLLSENYLCHLLVLRRDLAGTVGSFNPAFDGSQDYDLVLRATAHAQQIKHIPKILYRWRSSDTSTATSIENKSYALHTAQSALNERCSRENDGLRAEPGLAAGRWRLRYPIPPGTRVSIIIASGGKVDVLRTNIDSIFQKTTYLDYEILVVDNSKTSAIEKLVGAYQVGHRNLRYLDWRNKPFNYSAINNAAAKQSENPVLLFLNDDTSVVSPDWLEAMIELVMRPEVGAVGAKLLYPNGAIQHAGVVMGLFDNCGHAFKGLDGSTGHYFDFSDVIRNVSAVTGACLMTRAGVFWQAGGFDENQFAVAFNDVDLCLKIGKFGYRVLYTPHAILYHHEAFSKSSKDLIPHPEEVAAMRFKWNGVIANDPYYSPNLTRNDENYALRTRM